MTSCFITHISRLALISFFFKKRPRWKSYPLVFEIFLAASLIRVGSGWRGELGALGVGRVRHRLVEYGRRQRGAVGNHVARGVLVPMAAAGRRGPVGTRGTLEGTRGAQFLRNLKVLSISMFQIYVIFSRERLKVWKTKHSIGIRKKIVGAKIIETGSPPTQTGSSRNNDVTGMSHSSFESLWLTGHFYMPYDSLWLIMTS